jgi:hypothetical protein
VCSRPFHLGKYLVRQVWRACGQLSTVNGCGQVYIVVSKALPKFAQFLLASLS